MPDEPAQPDEPFGAPIPEVFPRRGRRPLVVSMSMANNDIDRALIDLPRSADGKRQDFTYRVRLVTGHVVEEPG
jgi:hypothetical protein